MNMIQLLVSVHAPKGMTVGIAQSAVRDALRGHGDFFGRRSHVKRAPDPQSNARAALTESVTWTPVEHGLPDADLTVNIELAPGAGEPVWLGYFDGEIWRDVLGSEVEVVAWSQILRGSRGSR